MVSRRRFLYEWYPETYEESHRRRPTYFNGPCVAGLNAYYNPAKPEDYRGFIETILDFLDFDDPRVQAGLIEAHFTDLIAADEENFYKISAPLVYDDFDKAAPFGGRWRLEIHREYICITFFVPIDLRISRPNEVLCIDVDGIEKAQMLLGSHDYGERVFKFLYDDMQRRIGKEMNKLGDDLKTWCGREQVEESVEPRLFADFLGAIVPWSCFAPCVPKADYPKFPNVEARGVRPADIDHFGSSAGRFLHGLWDKGLSAWLLGSDKDDCVACFMQEGHSIYVSNVGKRSGVDDQSPLKYLIMYSDQPVSALAYREGEVSPLEIRTNHDDLKSSWRLCRFIGRLHDLGVVRLAALKNLRRMKRFNHFLRDVEYRVQEIDPTLDRNRSLSAIDREIHDRAAAVGESVYHRSLRANYYLMQMRNIVEDIGIIGIPGFQDYRQFIRRYLYQSVESIAGVGIRYRRVVEQMGTKHGISNAASLLNIQRIADATASIIVLYYIIAIPLRLSEYYRRLQGVEEPPVAFYWIGLALVVLAYLALSKRVYRTAKEVGRDSRGIPSLAIVLAYAFALPHLIVDYLLRPAARFVRRLRRGEFRQQPEQEI